MFVVMRASGHVDTAVPAAPLSAGEAVTVTFAGQTQSAKAGDGGVGRGCGCGGPERATRGLRRGRRAFVLNTPADPAGDTDAAERRTIATILATLDGSGLEQVVAASTYDVQPGESIGDLSTLWAVETGLRTPPFPPRSWPGSPP